ncbi:F-box only protein 8-like [Rhododendron vialii]|uniref:F-box only protein 8-like n=1 Tax=Rhododendron vialii TaxID=182163 RepID=UPI00265D7273|nr:F-box only protein 8-like [Rhododendron vialii]
MAIDGELPDDVLKEILSGLPVKSLLRFLSVSKYWYSLILNPSFVSLHRNLAASIAKDTNAHCLLVKRFPHDGGDNLFCGPDCNETSLFYDKLVLSLVPVETPVGDLDISFTGLNVKDLNLLHSSNGLVLVATLYESDIRSFNEIDSPFEKYDECTEAGQRIVDEKVLVYNMSSDSWREVRTVMPKDVECSFCPSLIGVFYWLACDSRSGTRSIVAFRMSDEVFDGMHIPKKLLKCLQSTTYVDFCVVNDSLALVLLPMSGVPVNGQLPVLL